MDDKEEISRLEKQVEDLQGLLRKAAEAGQSLAKQNQALERERNELKRGMDGARSMRALDSNAKGRLTPGWSSGRRSSMAGSVASMASRRSLMIEERSEFSQQLSFTSHASLRNELKQQALGRMATSMSDGSEPVHRLGSPGSGARGSDCTMDSYGSNRSMQRRHSEGDMFTMDHENSDVDSEFPEAKLLEEKEKLERLVQSLRAENERLKDAASEIADRMAGQDEGNLSSTVSTDMEQKETRNSVGESRQSLFSGDAGGLKARMTKVLQRSKIDKLQQEIEEKEGQQHDNDVEVQRIKDKCAAAESLASELAQQLKELSTQKDFVEVELEHLRHEMQYKDSEVQIVKEQAQQLQDLLDNQHVSSFVGTKENQLPSEQLNHIDEHFTANDDENTGIDAEQDKATAERFQDLLERFEAEREWRKAVEEKNNAKDVEVLRLLQELSDKGEESQNLGRRVKSLEAALRDVSKNAKESTDPESEGTPIDVSLIEAAYANQILEDEKRLKNAGDAMKHHEEATAALQERIATLEAALEKEKTKCAKLEGAEAELTSEKALRLARDERIEFLETAIERETDLLHETRRAEEELRKQLNDQGGDTSVFDERISVLEAALEKEKKTTSQLNKLKGDLEVTLRKQLSESKTSSEERINELEASLEQERAKTFQLERVKADMEAEMRKAGDKAIDTSPFEQRISILEAALEKEKKQNSQLERSKAEWEASQSRTQPSEAPGLKNREQEIIISERDSRIKDLELEIETRVQRTARGEEGDAVNSKQIEEQVSEYVKQLASSDERIAKLEVQLEQQQKSNTKATADSPQLLKMRLALADEKQRRSHLAAEVANGRLAELEAGLLQSHQQVSLLQQSRDDLAAQLREELAHRKSNSGDDARVTLLESALATENEQRKEIDNCRSNIFSKVQDVKRRLDHSDNYHKTAKKRHLTYLASLIMRNEELRIKLVQLRRQFVDALGKQQGSTETAVVLPSELANGDEDFISDKLSALIDQLHKELQRVREEATILTQLQHDCCHLILQAQPETGPGPAGAKLQGAGEPSLAGAKRDSKVDLLKLVQCILEEVQAARNIQKKGNKLAKPATEAAWNSTWANMSWICCSRPTRDDHNDLSDGDDPARLAANSVGVKPKSPRVLHLANAGDDNLGGRMEQRASSADIAAGERESAKKPLKRP